jgi:NAD(P)-dependent dehydrogenase (short-subunit alcohol dehydrogenase family)
MKEFKGRTAVITGAASGFGLETSRIAAQRGMNVVMADLRAEPLEKAAEEVRALGGQVMAFPLDVAKADRIEALAAATMERFGAPHFVFNNAGVAMGGLVWENTVKDWEWVLGVNVMGVVNGVRVFTPLMLAAAKADPSYEGHIVNTASMAGLLTPPNMGIYNVSKHAVVALSETLYQDLSLVTDQVHAHVLCPYFVPTGIGESEKHRPQDMLDEGAAPTRSQVIGRAMSSKAIGSGRVTAPIVAGFVFESIEENRFYIFSHPNALKNVQTRMEDVVLRRNPTDPFAERPEVGAQLREQLRAE